MALSYKARRRWSLAILILGVPAYIVLVVTVLGWVGEMHSVVQFFVYVILGVAWAIPLKFVFKGIGQADPDAN